jgi:hypothetical protein
MYAIRRVADRLLSAVVPEIEASACCANYGKSYTNVCGCTDGKIYSQTCTYNCSCKAVCGPCEPIAGSVC